jgi:hypothetical protein
LTALKKILMVTAALTAAVAVFAALTIQPRRLHLAASADGTVVGVIHIHTSRSDGSRGPDDIALAAARAGLQFVVFTDHGDGTRKPDPPAYRSGVLCLDGVEISTTGGHYIALDMPPAPYPLGGEARDVVEDVRRLGGFGIVAHPDSPKPELQWREWDAPFDAIEMVNPDTGWRVQAHRSGWRSKMRLLSALVGYPVRPAETIAGLLSEDTSVTLRWAAIARERPLVTLGGADAHARLALRDDDPEETSVALPLPGYEPAFRVLSVRVHPDRPLSGNAPDDAVAILRAIRAGHLHTTIDGIASPGALTFTATHAAGTAKEGDELRVRGSLTLRVRTNAPPSFTTTVYNGDQIVSSDHHEADFALPVSAAPAVYWVGTRATGRSADVVWMRSNPIYVRPDVSSTPAAPPAPVTSTRPIFDGTEASGWTAEHDPTSVAALDVAPAIGGHELRLRFGLSNQITPAPAVALTYSTPGGLADFDRLTFTARAERPMRVSVQLRVPRPDRNGWDRWQRSVFIDVADVNRTVAFGDFRPVGIDQRSVPRHEAVRSIMFVIDPVNTRRGSSSRLWIRHAALERIRN